MSLTTLALIGLSSLSWSLLDTSRKKLVEHLAPIPVVVWLMLLQTPIFMALAATEAWVAPPPDYWGPALISIVLNTIANILFVVAVGLAPLSLAIPVLSLGPVFSSLGGFFVLGEPTTARQAIGIAIIVATTLALGLTGSRQAAGAGNKGSVRDMRRGLLMMVVVSALFSISPVFDKMGLRSLPSSQHAFIQCCSIALILGLWLKLKKAPLNFGQVVRNWRWLLTAVSFAAFALLTQFLATQAVQIGIFEALKRSGGLLAALTLGWIFFGEKITATKFVLVVVMGFGIFVLLT